MGLEDKRLLIVVDNADYRAALSDVFMPDRLVEELSERVSPEDLNIIKAAATWSEQLQEVGVFSCQSAEAFSDVPYIKIHLLGSGVGEQGRDRDLVKPVSEFCPTHVVLCARSPAILNWCIRNKLATIVLLSRWQEPLGWWQAWQHERWVNLLNHKQVQWVGCHGVQACKVLATSGVNPQKLIPWEWPHPELIGQYAHKEIQVDQSHIRLVYVGPIQSSAGLQDIVEVMALLAQNNRQVSLDLVSGASAQENAETTPEIHRLQQLADSYGLRDHVHLALGLSPESMLKRVHGADLLVIPRPAQALPAIPFSITLAMAARTPVIAPDHPYFNDHLFHSVNAMIFPLGNIRSMAHRIERIMGQPALYAQLSNAAYEPITNIKVPARWPTLIHSWLEDTAYDRQQLRNQALSSGRYQSLLRQPVSA